MPVSFLNQEKAKIRSFELPISLTPCQKLIDSSKARFKIIRAGRKFGKSTYAMFSCIKRAGKPNSIIWFCAPTYRQGKLIAWREFKRLIPREALAKKPNETDLVITLRNGSEIYVMGADNADSLRGPAPDHVASEESAMQQAMVWHEVLRPNLTAKMGTADFITTPRGYNWFYDLEEKARQLIHAGSKDWSVFHYTIFDNPHINRAEIEQAKSECGNDILWNQEYLAKYESSKGRVFSAFSAERHCEEIAIPATRTEVYRSIDFGMRDNTACLWSFIRGGVLYIYREHLQNDTPATVQAGLIRNKTTNPENVLMNAISHDAAKEDANMTGLTVKWHFENAGIRPLYLSSRKKDTSRNMIQQLIHENRIKIDRYKCPKLYQQMLSYEWNDTITEGPMKPEDGNDDAVDALHYLVELLQTRLYLNRPSEETEEEKYKKIKAELLAQRTQPRKWKIAAQEQASYFDFEDTSAGYLQ